MTESQLQVAIRVALGREPGVVLWRNTTGVGIHPGGRTVRYGLARGSADLIGILAPTGRFLALEVKTPRGRVTSDQQLFLELIWARGGFACVVRSVADAHAAIARARHGHCW